MVFVVKILLQSYFVAIKETFILTYMAITNATLLGIVLYVTRLIIRFSLWITNLLIDQTKGKTNPIVKVYKVFHNSIAPFVYLTKIKLDFT